MIPDIDDLSVNVLITTEDEIFTSILKTMNEALEADPRATSRLVSSRTPCNPTMASHPTIQVFGEYRRLHSVGSLGLINGICESLTGHRIAAVYDDSRPDQIVRFVKYESKTPA